jgi:hypothetical protein
MEAWMITALTITSLDQGKALARRQVETLLAEPVGPAPLVQGEEHVVSEPGRTPVDAVHRPRPSFAMRILAVWDPALPNGAGQR